MRTTPRQTGRAWKSPSKVHPVWPYFRERYATMGRRKKSTFKVPPGWHRMPGPTALAKMLLTRGESDDNILIATKTVFAKRTKGPHLFTRADLKRLRSRMLAKYRKQKRSAKSTEESRALDRAASAILSGQAASKKPQLVKS